MDDERRRFRNRHDVQSQMRLRYAMRAATVGLPVAMALGVLVVSLDWMLGWPMLARIGGDVMGAAILLSCAAVAVCIWTLDLRGIRDRTFQRMIREQDEGK